MRENPASNSVIADALVRIGGRSRGATATAGRRRVAAALLHYRSTGVLLATFLGA
jgi:hypothetical protein